MADNSFLYNHSSEKLVKVLDVIPDGLIILNEDGSPVYINHAACTLFQLEANQNPSLLKPLLPGLLNFDPLSFDKTSKKELTISESSYHVFIFPLYDNSNKTGVVLFFKDVSIMKEANEIKTDFVSIASHELRTPLTSVKMALDILHKMGGGENQEKLLNIAVRNTERISILISQYLDITKIETGKTSSQFKKVILDDFIEDIMDEFKEKSENKQISFKSQLSAGLPPVLADPPKLEQIFFNLLGNALKFTNKQGTITISAATPADKPDDLMGRDMVLLTIADTGIGIPQDKKELIFDKFYRVKKSLEMEKDGVGLGLSIVKKLIELHGGEISVEDNEPAGTRFCFTLPVYAGERRDPGFRWIFDSEFKKARKNHTALSLIVVLIENYYPFHAQMGRDETDVILQDMEDVIKKSLHRQSDNVVHRREKEMFVVFCEAEREGAGAISRRIKENIGQLLNNQYIKLPIDPGLRIGFSTYPDDTDNQRDLFKNALNNAGEE